MNKIVEWFGTVGKDLSQSFDADNTQYYKQDVELLNNFKGKTISNFQLSERSEEILFEFSDGNKLSVGVNCESLDFENIVSKGE